MEQRNKISFKGQNIYIGLDVHLKSWSVTILSETSVLKKYSQDASPEVFVDHQSYDVRTSCAAAVELVETVLGHEFSRHSQGLFREYVLCGFGCKVF